MSGLLQTYEELKAHLLKQKALAGDERVKKLLENFETEINQNPKEKLLDGYFSSKYKHLNTIFNSLNTGVYIIEPNTKKILEVNDYALELLKYKRKDLIGQRCSDVLCGLKKKNCIIKQGKEFQLEQSCKLKDANGKKIPVIKTVKQIKIEGELLLIETFTNITKQKHHEDKLAEREGILNATLQATDEGILVVDENYNIINSNEQFFNLWELDANKIDSKNIHDAFKKSLKMLVNSDEIFLNNKNIANTSEKLKDTLLFKDGRVFERYSFPIFKKKKRVGRVWRIKDITAQAKAEAKLKELNEELETKINDRTLELKVSENRLKEAQEIAKLGHWILDSKTRLIKGSENAYQLIGLKESADSLSLEEFFELVHPNDVDLLKNGYKHSVEKKEAFNAVHRLKDANGKTIYLRQKCRTFYDKNDKAIYSLGVMQDITEQKLAGNAIKKSEQQLNMAMEGTGLGLWDWNIKTDQILINNKFIEMIGYKGVINKSEIGFSFLFSIIHKDDRDRIKNSFSIYKSSNSETFEEEFRLKPAKDDYIWVHARAKVFEWDGDNPLRSLGTFLDITERRKAEIEMKKSEEKFRKLTQLSPSPICIQSIDKLLFVNPAWVKAIGYTPHEALKMSFVDLVHPDDKELATRYSKLRLLGNDAPKRYEIKMQTKAKETKWFDISVTVIKYEEQKTSLAVMNDITDRKIAEEKIKKSQQELQVLNAQKDKFFSIISHDLKGPIGNFMNFADLLKNHKELLTSESAEAIIDHSYNLANNTYKLLENLLIWSKSQLGGIKINRQMLPLSPLMAETIALLNDGAKSKGVSIVNKIEKAVFIFADKDTILTVLRNLVSNAIKFTPSGGEVLCSSKNCDKKADKNKAIEISISDTGVGIPEEKVDDLFTLGKEFSTFGTNKEKGTGLGLILCKELITLNEGEIWAKSKKDEGSTFTFRLRCTPEY